MQFLYTLFMVIFSTSYLFSQIANEVPIKKWIKLRVPETETPLDARFIPLDRAKFDPESRQLDIVVTDKEYAELLSYGYQIDVLSHDMQADYAPRLRRSPTAPEETAGHMIMTVPEEYHTYDEVVEHIFSLQTTYPDIVKVDSIGTTHEGRAIWLVKIAEDVGTDYPEKSGVLYLGLHHAREIISVEVLIYFMDHLVTEYDDGNPEIIDMLLTRQLWFIPVVNPDGHTYFFETDVTWRKNRSDNGDGTFGVNLNRNYPYKWGFDNIGSSPSTNNGNYRGPSALSEPEAIAVHNFHQGAGSENRNIVLSISYHSWANLYFYPWAHEFKVTDYQDIYWYLAKSASKYNGYEFEYDTPIWSPANGELNDYEHGEIEAKNRVIGLTPEVGDEFLPDTSKILALVQENLGPNLFFAREALYIGRYSRIVESVGELTVSPAYAVPGQDSLIVMLKLEGDSSNIIFLAEIDSLDGSPIDSIQLFDDGGHNDGIAGDSIYGNVWMTPSGIERHHSVNIIASIMDTDTVNLSLNRKGFFTTIGPIIYDSSKIVFNNGSLLFFDLNLTNLGMSSTATNTSAQISTTDSCVTEINSGLRSFGDIVAGATAKSTSRYSIDLNQNCALTDTLFIPFDIEISSDGYSFWTDSFELKVPPIIGVEEEITGLPTEYSLSNAYPNPFNPTTTIEYSLPISGNVSLIVYNLLGQKVAKLLSEPQQPGYHSVTWDASSMASGIYFYRLQAGDFVQTRKMVLLK